MIDAKIDRPPSQLTSLAEIIPALLAKHYGTVNYNCAGEILDLICEEKHKILDECTQTVRREVSKLL